MTLLFVGTGTGFTVDVETEGGTIDNTFSVYTLVRYSDDTFGEAYTTFDWNSPPPPPPPPPPPIPPLPPPPTLPPTVYGVYVRVTGYDTTTSEGFFPAVQAELWYSNVGTGSKIDSVETSGTVVYTLLLVPGTGDGTGNYEVTVPDLSSFSPTYAVRNEYGIITEYGTGETASVSISSNAVYVDFQYTFASSPPPPPPPPHGTGVEIGTGFI